MRYLALLAVLIILFAPLSPRPAAAQEEAAWLLAQINALRQRNGQVLLTINPHLTASAAAHSAYLANHPYSDPHREVDGSTPQSRAMVAGYTGKLVGENVVGGTGASVQWAFNWWMKSPIHLYNMLAGWTEIGIAMADGPYGRWYTTDFGDQGGGMVAPTDPPAPAGTNPNGANPTPQAQGAQPVAQSQTGAPFAPAAPRPTRRPTQAPTFTPTITLTPSVTFTKAPTFTPTATNTGLPPTPTAIVLEVTPQTAGSDPGSASNGATPLAVAVATLPPSGTALPGSTPAQVAMIRSDIAPPAPASPNTGSDPIRALIPWFLVVQGVVVGGLIAGSVIRKRRH